MNISIPETFPHPPHGCVFRLEESPYIFPDDGTNHGLLLIGGTGPKGGSRAHVIVTRDDMMNFCRDYIAAYEQEQERSKK